MALFVVRSAYGVVTTRSNAGNKGVMRNICMHVL